MVDGNRTRRLADVVTIDAWHAPFSEQNERVDLHVDVAFGIGRIGGEEESSVRFRLCLKQAEIVVVVPPTEPASIDKRSVRRDAPALVKGSQAETRKVSKQASAGVDGQMGVSLSGPRASARTAAKAGVASKREQTVSLATSLQGMSILQSQTGDGDYKWTVSTTTIADHLEGRPWDATRAPLLKVIDGRTDRSRGLAPTVRVEVRCRREDLDITDIALKNEPNWLSFRRSKLHRNREIAAEALIRTRLFEEGLFSGDLSDPFAYLTLAVITAEGT